MISRLMLFVFAGAIALQLGALPSTASAQEGGEEAIKYRKSVMTAVRGHMGAMASIMKGAGNKSDLGFHADAMVRLSDITASAFPEGSDFGDTTALPGIWEKPDEFAAAIEKFRAAAKDAAGAATSGDMAAFGKAFGMLGGTCKGCHENFREKKQH